MIKMEIAMAHELGLRKYLEPRLRRDLTAEESSSVLINPAS